MNQPFIPTQITTGSFLQTVSGYHVSVGSNSSDDTIRYLTQTHCPENMHQEMISNIDLIKVTFSKKTQAEIANIKVLFNSYLRQVGIASSTKKPTLRHHKNGIKLFPLDETNDCCGSIKWDMEKGIVQLELTGKGCCYVNATAQKFNAIYALLKHFRGKVTEIDIAVDDYSGKFNLRYVQKAHSAGDYNPLRGCRPVRNSKGKYPGTEYLGSSDSAKSLCVYDKSQEQALPKKHSLYGLWTRHEVTLRRKNNHIINDNVLLNPDSYFVGAYPKVHKRIIKTAIPRCPVREVSLERTNSLSKSVANAQYQYGRTIGRCRDLMADGEATLDLLSREGSPKKFLLPSYLDEATLRESVGEQCGGNFNAFFASLVSGHNPSNIRVSRRGE